jgi:hypothetical protein
VMKYQSVFKVLLPLIFGLALVAAGMGLFDQAPGHSYALTNFRGEQVTINGRGLYYWDTLSAAAQMQANDLITLVVGLPLLALGAWLAFRGSLRGQLLLTGTLGYFLYTYLSMCMLAAYNGLFLVYVALFGLSLYAFALSLMGVDVAALPGRFSARFPRGWVAGLLFLVGGFLLAAWLGRVVPELLNPQTPAALENATTRVMQAMVLALVAPLAVVGGVLLLRRQPWGYLLASVVVLKGLTLALAVSVMAINMTLAGVPDSLGFMAPFLVLTALNLVAGVVLLRNIQEITLKPQVVSLPQARTAAV